MFKNLTLNAIDDEIVDGWMRVYLFASFIVFSRRLGQERADTEWKFARSKLWISYFEEGGTVPPPFNVIPTPKSIFYMCRWLHRKLCGHSRAAKKEHMRTIRVGGGRGGLGPPGG